MTLMQRVFQSISNHKLVFAGILITLIGAVAGGIIWSQRTAEASAGQDCSNYAIIKCGFSSKSDFAGKYKQKSEYKAIYAAFGLSSGEIDRFKQTAKAGKIYKDGRIVVDGQVVATNAKMLRHVEGQSKKVIDGKTYYLNSPTFNSYDAYVMFDKNGKVEFVVAKSCGNPVQFTQPTFRCDLLTMKKINRNTYEFNTKATAKDGAKITKVVYDFGDGNKKEEKNPSTVVKHVYDKPGDYKAKVTVHFDVHGKSKTHTSGNCEKPLTVEEPPKPVYECKQLTATLVPGSKNEYEFTATGYEKNGAKLVSGSFDFGDGNNQNDIAASGLTAKTSHEYAQTGAYTVNATLKFNIGETQVEAKCSTEVNPEVPQPVYECSGLEMTKVSRVQYDFKASSKVENAELVGYKYVVSGPETKEEQLTEGEKFTFTSQTPGTYTVNAYAIVKIDGEVKETPASENCAKQFTIEEAPVAECTTLIATLRDGTRNTYDYEVQTNITGDAQVVDYTFDFGDGSEAQTTTEPTTSYTYGNDGEYTTKVIVKFTVESQEVTSECQVNTSVEPEQEYCEVPGKEHLPKNSPECEEQPEECKPGIPVGDERCEEKPEEYCPYPGKEELPADSKDCEEEVPSELPATGPTSIIASAVGISSLAGAGYYWRASRNELLSRFKK